MKNPINILILLAIVIQITYIGCKKEEILQEEPPLPPGEIIYIPADYPTIKLAVNAAGINDTVFVASGYYHEHDIQLKAGTHLIGVAGVADSVIIDADSLGRCILFSGDQYAATISGITLKGGRSNPEGPYGKGGGLYAGDNANLYVGNCKFIENVAYNGGGAYTSCSITFSNCLFENNISNNRGNGAYVSGVTSTIEGCTFRNNTAGYSIYYGGGTGGGGIYTASPTTSVKNCTFLNNESSYKGGGIFAINTITIQFCVFANNSTLYEDHGGGALYWNSDNNYQLATMENCTMTGNSSANTLGSGIYGVGGSMIIQNSIISNGVTGTSIYVSESLSLTIECTDIWGNEGGNWVGRISDFANQNGNFSLDPQYSTEYYNINSSSPCASSNNSCNILIGAMEIQ